uniref:Uncharacterized protein n=1 Tax=Cacopsylla melanoneura TaxID=428564 RepID=A0A8D8YPY1_9HEMI
MCSTSVSHLAVEKVHWQQVYPEPSVLGTRSHTTQWSPIAAMSGVESTVPQLMQTTFSSSIFASSSTLPMVGVSISIASSTTSRTALSIAGGASIFSPISFL